MLQKEQFLKLSQDQKKQYLLELRGKMGKDSRSSENPASFMYPVIHKKEDQKHQLFPLTDIQESFLVGRYYGAEKDKVGCHVYCEFEGNGLDSQRLKDTWNQLVIHHDMLHTMIQSDGKQCIMAEIPEYEIPVHDLQKSDDEDVTKHIDAIRDQLSHKVYEPNQWPLFEIHISLLPHRKVLVHMSIDEWIVDAASVDLLLNQWYRLYHDPEYTLPVLDVSFRDVVMAWKEFEHSPVFQRDLTYWMEKLKEITDGPKLSTSTPELLDGKSYVPRSRYRGRLEKSTWNRLKQKAVELNVSPTVLLLTLFSKALAEYSHSKEFSLILTFFNRLPLHPQLDQVVGPFISTNIFVANQINTGWETQAKEYQTQVWKDLDHSSVSGIRAIRELRTRKPTSSIPIIPVVFTSMLNNVGKNGTETQTWFNHLTYNITQTPQVYLDHQVMEREGNLEFNWDIAEGYIPKHIVDKMFSRYLSLLQESAQEESPSSPSTKEKGEPFRLTDLQQTYVLSRLQGSGNGNNCQMYQEFKVEDLDLSRLSQAWNRLIAHHDMLRAVVNKDGTQKILSDVSPYEIIINDAFQASEDTEAYIEGIRNEMAQHVFPLGKWPLFDLRVTRIDEKKACIHLCTDALIADGASLFLLYQQLFDLYQQPGSSLPELTFSYQDYVGFKKEKKHSVEYKEACLYWETKMKSISRGPTFKRDIRHKEERIRMEGTLTNWNSLKKIAKKKGVTPGAVLLTVYHDILTSYLPSPFTTVVVNWDRPSIHQEIEQIMGDFTALSWVQSASSHLEFIARVRKNHMEIRQDISHSLVSGLHGLRKRAIENKEEGFLNFPIVFTNLLDNQAFNPPPSWELGYGTSKTPGVVLDNISFEVGKSLHFHWDIMKDVFPSHVQEEMFDLYRQRLTELSTDESRWDEVQGESGNENLNKGQGEHMKETQSELCLHQWFEQQVQIRPNAIALKWEQEVITYQELNERANQVAHYLHSCGVGPGVMVGICVNRSIEMVVGILGTLKAGGAYVPLDPSHPRERLGFILEDSQVSLVLTQKDTESSLPDTNTRIIHLDQENNLFKDQPISNISIQMNSHHLAYVIYTSGSTGTPKGVLITHQNVVRLFTQTEKWYGFNHQDVWTLYHSYAFDFSVWEIFGSLLYGGKLVIVPYKVSRSFESFYDLLSQEQVTVLNQTPTAFRQLISVEDQALTPKPLALRYVIFGGEALDPRMLKPWFTRHGDQTPQLVNMYGITETTVHVTYRPLTVQDTLRQDSVIGHPIPDLHVHILDENLQPVPTGTVGEMYIGGEGVARGYLNREQLDKERFIKNPFTAKQERLYKSGDLARYNEKHEIEFIGRNDHQVKVRGFRIELGEIETILNSNDSIRDSVVTVKQDDNGEPQIVAYLVTDGPMPLASAIRKYVKEKLPSYMVPNIVTSIKNIPITVNGKLDYKQLPWPVINEAKGDTEVLNITEKLLQDLGEILKQKIEPSDNIFDLGATSLTIVNITQKIQRNYEVSVPVDVFLESITIKDVIQYIENNIPKLSTKEDKDDEIIDETIQSIEQFLGNLIQEAIQVTDIANDEDIFNLGVTSLTIINIAQTVKKEKGISIPVEVFLEHPTISEIATYVCKQFSNEEKKVEVTTSDIQHEPLSIALNPIEFEDRHYLSTALRQNYQNRTLSFKEFSRFIGLLKIQNIDGKDRYLYPSAGGKYAIQSYVLIKEGSVEGINEGIYYYHPEKHALLLVNKEGNISSSVFMRKDRTIFNQSGICVFFVAQLEALAPFYGEFSTGLATIDAGYINQLFMGRINQYNFNLHPIEALNFSEIENQFVLDKGHMYVHSILVGNFASPEQDMSKSACEEELRTYLEIGNHKIIPIKGMSKTIQYPSLTMEQIEEYKNKSLHIRVAKETNQLIPLEENAIPEEDYRVRFCYREYDKQEVKFEELSKLLALLRGNIKNNEKEYLYSPIQGQRAINIYLYIKNEAIEGIKNGLYKYDPDKNQLELIKESLSYKLEYTHSPFNRIHYRNSAFSIFLTTKREKLEENYKEYGLQYASFEAGSIGQLMLDRQAECSVGLVPIGGLNFDKIRDDFELESDEILIHSFLGGSVNHKYTRNTNNMLQTKVLNKVEEKIKDDQPNNGIAVIGLSGKYPGANSMSEFWGNLQKGKHSITDIGDERSRLYGWNSSKDSNKKEDMWSGYLKDIDKFDSLLFNITPAEAKQMDPQERLSLEVSWECLEDAGYTSDSLKNVASKVGVFVGAMWNDYQEYGIEEWNKNGEAQIAALHSSIANRISHYFGFNGPSIALNTSCSSSLTAIHLAIESVKKGECEAALVLGVNIMSHPYHYESLLQRGLLSQDDKSYVFSINGSGLVPGEGVGAILIRPLKQAVKDQDHIYGVIKGAIVSHYGEAVRYGMPNTDMQIQSISDLLEDTGTVPNSISYIECAATGSSIADASEVKALTEVFHNQDLLIGSLKPNIGHLESASTMSQLTKVLLQLKNKKLVPTIHSQPVNPLIPLDQCKIEIVKELQEWNSEEGKPRRAVISSYGATGSIGNLLVEEYIADKVVRPNIYTEVCIPFSAKSAAQLLEYVNRFSMYLNTIPNDVSLEDIAHTLCVGKKQMKERLVVIAHSISDLIDKLHAFISTEGAIQGVYRGTVHKVINSGNVDYTELSAIATAWVQGEQVILNQHSRYAQKVSLPTYPFSRDSHWCNSSRNSGMKEVNLVTNNDVDNVNDVEEAKPMINLRLKERVEHYLMSIFAHVTEIPIGNLDVKTSFDAYGINSLLITKMNERLEKDLGSIAKTLFFENQSIEELTVSMTSRYERAFLNLFGEENLEQKEESISVPIFKKIEATSNEIDVDDIAIVGISGKYPDAENLQEFWGNLKSGVDSITEIPLERWDYRKYYNPEKGNKGTVYGKWGGFIKDVSKFDPLFFNISPKEAELTDPQERLFLQVAWECVEDSGYTRQSLNQKHKGNIGVFAGAMYQEYTLHGHSQEGGEELNFALGSSAGSIANRVSYFFNFQGPSLTIDTMCSSALTGLHYAVESVKRGECEAAIVGGVNLLLHPNKYLMHSQMHMLSTDGRCRSFGKGGDGFVPGEGVGAILIKPLQRAVEDGDNIYAIVKGTAINNDGKTNGYTVPNPKQQEQVITNALSKANIDPRTISYIEAHGTGTALGDPIEIAGLSNAYKKFTHETQFCSIGSVKSNIGHCESAAGIAGITKVILQLRHKLLVPSLHAEELNPDVTFEETPFYVQRELTEWKKPTLLIDGQEERLPRIAGISSFGAGGVNAHVILEEYEPPEEKLDTQESREIILLSARSKQELNEYARNLLSFFKGSTKETVKIDKDLIIEKVIRCVAKSIKIESSDLDIQENIGSYFDGIAYRNMANMLFTEFEKNIELPSIIEGFSVQTLVDRIVNTVYPVSVEEEEVDSIYLKDVAHTLKVGREPMQYRLALVVTTIDELIEKIDCFIKEQPTTLNGIFYSTDNENDKNNYLWNESEVHDIIQRWILSNELTKLAQIWVNGVNIDWSKNNEKNKRRISLPTYPFKKDKYWLSNTLIDLKQKGIEALHPLIDRNTSTLDEQCFEKTFYKKDIFTQQYGSAFVPILIPLEMARKASELSTKEKVVQQIQDVTCYSPLRYIGDVINSSIVMYREDNKILFEIESKESESVVLNYEGRIVCTDSYAKRVNDLKIDISTIQNTFQHQITKDQLYEEFTEHGWVINEKLKSIQNIYYSENKALAQVDISSNQQELVLNPSVLDGIMQSIMGMNLRNGKTDMLPYQPYYIKNVHINDSLEGLHYIYISRNPDTDNSYDIEITNESGEVLVSLEKLLFEKTGTTNERNDNNLSDNMQFLQESVKNKTQIDVRNKCLEIIVQVLGLEGHRIELKKSFSEYGMDSISVNEISKHIQNNLNLNVKASEFFEASCIEDFLEKIVLLSLERPEKLSEMIIDPIQATNVVAVKKEHPKKRRRIGKSVERNDSQFKEPIAIIGMDGRLPGSDTIEEFWQNISRGETFLSEIPKERWDWKAFYGDPNTEENRTDVKWGGFLKEVDKFDCKFFGISPNEAKLMDPQQRLFLETVWKTIENAGYKASTLSGSKTGVFIGANTKDYEQLISDYEVPIEAYMATGNSHSILANRISYFYNLTGPSEAIDTACSSSLVALHRAVQSIRLGECKTAIAGGVNLLLSPKHFISYRKAGMLSQDEKVKTFDKDADGYLRGEGIGAVLLKPLSQAKKEGDHIYAVIKGSAVNHSGKGFSLTTPNPSNQAKVIQEAWRETQVDPSTISYIEAQGTGTLLGDVLEIDAFKKAIENQPLDINKTCGIGSVKPNIGHLEAASGMASIFKVIKSFEHKIIPKTANITELNPEIQLEGTPFYIVDETVAWETQIDEQKNSIPRRASIHSFGVGGSNVHIVLEEYEQRETKAVVENSESPYIFTCSAKNQNQLKKYVYHMLQMVYEKPLVNFGDFIYTCQVARESMEERIAIIVQDREDFIRKCNLYLDEPLPSYSWLYKGNTHQNDVDILDVFQKGVCEYIIQDSLRERDFTKIAILWTKGIDFDWNSLYMQQDMTKVMVPTYPFERNRYWITDYRSTSAVLSKKMSSSDDVLTRNTEEKLIKSSNKEYSEKDDFISTIKQGVANILGFSIVEIPENIPLYQLGFDSVSATKLKYWLESEHGIEVQLSTLNNSMSVEDFAEVVGSIKKPDISRDGSHDELIDISKLDIDSLSTKELESLFVTLKN